LPGSAQADYIVTEDGRSIGRIYEDRHTPPEQRWFWSITILRRSRVADADPSECHESACGPPTEAALPRQFSNLLGKIAPLLDKLAIRRFHHRVACLRREPLALLRFGQVSLDSRDIHHMLRESRAGLMLGCDRDLANGVAVPIRNDNCRAP
jgi:hypothetical protein